MKNISRRVFIKGLAVAGVAAAASTVLAGCNTNMIPGVGDNTDEQPVEDTTNTFTFKDGDKTLTITLGKFVTDKVSDTATAAAVLIPVSVTNGLDGKVTFVDEDITTAAAGTSLEYTVVMSLEETNDKNATKDLAFESTGSYAEAVLVDAEVAKGFGDDYVLVTKEASTNWAKMKLTMKVYKATKTGTTYFYDINKEDEKYEYTFSK